MPKKNKRPVSESQENQPQTNGEIATATEVQAEKKVFRYKSPFIDTALCDLLAEDTVEIKNHLVSQGQGDQKTGELLNRLKLLFQAVAINLGTAEDLEWEAAFNEYVQIQFGIKGSRASEYIRASLVLENYKNLNLEASKLVEISRLDSEGIDNLLKHYTIEKLRDFTFREVKNVVRKFNPKKRDTTPVNKNKTAKTPKTPTVEPKDTGFTPSNVTNLEAYIKNTKSTPSKAFAAAAEVLKKEVETNEITEELCSIIDDLYKWKAEKLAKKASGQ
ncbi:MAG: hypothetical protein HOP07_15925 [Bacteriovoracaceae bacterium]|nr:hypothetical protein [Bacteriovoracaceae bacterium]